MNIFIIKHMALILCFNLISNVKSNCHIKLSQQCVCHTVNYNKNKLINKLNRFFALQIKSTWLLSPSVLQFTSQKTSKRYYMYLITSLGFLMILSNFFKSLHTFEKNSSNTYTIYILNGMISMLKIKMYPLRNKIRLGI